ncbi:MAG TPA: FimV/HubP family polar landmark protein, partial [Gammaproteobacteria bacterium]|nr:FimV/HubP family polar landmark protein [Gammaproteobacteria bacterium]
MSRKLILLGVLSLILAPGAALSLGLGDIRLNSYLNQPMNAEIALSIASPAELESLQIRLAPAAAFSRYGLDRPAFLDDLRFQVRRTGAASAVVQVTSTRPVAEPFVTFLVEAAWSGGQMLREYTVLLDPPTFMPAPEAAPASPAAVDTPRQAPVARPAPAPAPSAAPTPLRSEYGAEFGPVQRNDTLWAIAQRVRPDTGLSTNQVMVALFRANPNAFDGNINRLRAGAILRVPSRSEMAATSGGEATAEVRRQNEAWRGAAAPVAERRLELAPPADTPPSAPAADPVRDATSPSPALAEAVDELRGELAETRRLMEVKDAEIAALQARLAELEEEGVPVAELPIAPVERPIVEAEPADELPAEDGVPAEAETEAEPVAEPE